MRISALFSMLIICASIPALAADYHCESRFEKSLKFELRVANDSVSISVPSVTCDAKFDASYRPTKKYEGYNRYVVTRAGWDNCKAMTESLLGKYKTFESIKVSPEVLAGETTGKVTFIYDYGAYHGELANEKMTCSAN